MPTWQRLGSTISACCVAGNSTPNLLRRVGTSPTVALARERWRVGIGVWALACGHWHLRGGVQAGRWRARGQRPRKQREAGPGAQASQQVWCATPTTPQKKPQRSRATCPMNATGLVGYPLCLAHQTYCDVSGQARPSRGWVRAAAFALSSAPNLFRRVGTSPTVALACGRWHLRGGVQAARWRASLAMASTRATPA